MSEITCPLCGREMTAIEAYPGYGELYCVYCDLTIGGNEAKTPDELKALLEQRTCKNIGDGTFVCSECGAYVQITDVGRSFLDESGKRWYWTSNKHKFRHCPNCGKRIEEEAE